MIGSCCYLAHATIITWIIFGEQDSRFRATLPRVWPRYRDALHRGRFANSRDGGHNWENDVHENSDWMCVHVNRWTVGKIHLPNIYVRKSSIFKLKSTALGTPNPASDIAAWASGVSRAACRVFISLFIEHDTCHTFELFLFYANSDRVWKFSKLVAFSSWFGTLDRNRVGNVTRLNAPECPRYQAWSQKMLHITDIIDINRYKPWV